jgi:aspartate/methionine/tyrosine aminotransferase
MALRRDVRPRVLARTRAVLTESWQHFSQWADESRLFEYQAPDAGAICFLRYSLPVNSSELAERLRAEQSVLIVPGDQFGIDQHIRLGYGLLPRDLLPALERVKTVFKAIRA